MGLSRLRTQQGARAERSVRVCSAVLRLLPWPMLSCPSFTTDTSGTVLSCPVLWADDLSLQFRIDEIHQSALSRLALWRNHDVVSQDARCERLRSTSQMPSAHLQQWPRSLGTAGWETASSSLHSQETETSWPLACKPCSTMCLTKMRQLKQYFERQ